MKITNMTYEIFRRAASRWTLDSHIMLYRREHFGADEILELVINWSALGDQTVDQTLDFSLDLNLAMKIADTINGLKFEVVRGTDPDLGSYEAMEEETEKVYELFREGFTSRIARWLEDRRIA